MNIHPVARLFPPMSESQYGALRDDIRDNGQREAITLWRGQVIDGLHRARACDELGFVPMTREWESEEEGLTGYVVSLNLHRRHLDESQRAMVAEKVTRNLTEAATARESARRGGPPVLINTGGRMPREESARLFNVGTTTIGKARVVRERGIPELAEAVERGEIAVNPAAKIAELPAHEQRAALAEPRTHKRHLNKHPTLGAMERVNRTVETFANLSDVLVETMPQMNGDKRRSGWAASLREVRTILTRFIERCEK